MLHTIVDDSGYKAGRKYLLQLPKQGSNPHASGVEFAFGGNFETGVGKGNDKLYDTAG